jgi:hypothetical protein
MTKRIGGIALVFCGFLMLFETAAAVEPAVPDPFQRFDDTSEYTINYDDLTELLRVTVVDAGPSTRELAQPAREITGTRMKLKVKKTANEGNRFHYETFLNNEAGRQYLRGIHENLQQLPTETPLENFSRDEQLAYWLNLYNVTVLNEVIAAYPKRDLKKLVQGRKSIFSKKLLTVAGIPLSLNDIQFTILNQNYDNNPLIMYGLYQGIVGGPNIRPSAYTGDDVYRALENNAYEFINSNRGTFSNDENVFLVSSLYERNRAYFPEFDSDLSQHLLKYLDGKERARLQAASILKPNINDWTVTDLGVARHQPGGSLAHNNAALLDSYRSDFRSVNGGVRVATLIIKRDEKDAEDEPQDNAPEDIMIEQTEGASVEGARMEEISTE